MTDVTLLKVFLSCPKDFKLASVERVIDRVSRITSDGHKVAFQAYSMHKGLKGGPARARKPNSAQARIDEQLKHFDVYIGFMWTRAGTATSKSPSGTVQEFRRFYQRWKRANKFKRTRVKPEVRFYFFDKPTRLSNVDTDQLVEIRKFEAELAKRSVVFKSLRTMPEITEDIRDELHAIAQSHARRRRKRKRKRDDHPKLKPTSANKMTDTVKRSLLKIARPRKRR